MVRKDYYLILGVPREADAETVRAAFRRRALEYHPDRAGSENSARFRDVVEAYEVLSNPERRRRYDHEGRPARVGLQSEPEPFFGVRSAEAEPLIPEPPPAVMVTVPESFRHVRPSADALFDRILRNFTGADVPKSEHQEPLNVEIVLAPVEAARGTIVRVGLPTFASCGWCHGSGRDWLGACARCNGAGVLRRDASVPVRVPPGCHDGDVVELPLSAIGVGNLHLRVHLRIDRAMQ